MSINTPVKSPVAALQVVRKPRRWRRRLVALAVVLAAGVWFAPAIAAKTGLKNRVAREALADLRGTVEVGGASLGWFSPVELRDVVVKDAQGRTLLAAPKITSSKSLLALLRDRSDLGEFTIEQPTAEVVCEKGSTNLEDALANYLKDDATPAPTRAAVTVRVSGAVLTLREVEKEQRFESIDATVVVPAARTEPVTAKLTATAPAASPGTVTADVSLGDTASLKLAAAGFPLEALAPVIKRADPGASVAGRLTADLTATWGKDAAGKARATVEGSASVRDFELAGPWLNGDHLRMAAADLPLKVEVAGRLVRVDRADLACDIGTLSAVGSFDPDEPLDKLLDKPGMKVEADVNLAKLAALLPRLLRVREGTAIRDGKLVAKLASRTSPQGTVWDGEVRTSALKAERGGQAIEWAEPLAVEFSGRIPAGHLPTFDKFVCRSDFVSVNAQGSPESFRAAANVYLDRLSARLGEFVDLGGAKLAGEASAWVVASRSPQGAFKADAAAELKGFAFADGAHRSLTEPALSVKASAAGTWPHGGAVAIETGTMSMDAGGDRLDLKLLEPIADAKQFNAGRLSMTLTGDLARWVGRARGFVPVSAQYVFGGTATARGTVRLQPDALKIDGLLVGIEKARFRGAGIDIDEPYMNAAADLTVSRATGSAEFANLQITSLGLNITEGKFAVEVPAAGPVAVSGSGKAATDLTRLGRTLQFQFDPKGDAFHGCGTGPIRFRWQGDTTTFGGTLDVTDFAFGDPKQTGISEPAFKLDLDGRYDETPDHLTLTRARVERPGLAVETKGTIAKLNTTQEAALDGTLTYDLAKLTPEVRNALGGGFQATGHGSRPFSLAGSLSPGGTVAATVGPPPSPFAKLTADAGIGWDSIKAYGFDVGPGALTVKLANGQATISPIRATFGGGQVAVTPALRLAPEPAELWLAKGKVVDRAKLTPAACAGALGYALPVIANAAQAEGEISAVLDDNRIPLVDFTKTTLKGQLIVHKATVGPGPVVTEIARVLGAASTTMTLANEMNVPVRVEGGRVYHENLSVTLNGYVVKTTGSVGFDGSLALVADVPIPGTFPGLKSNPALKKALEGKVVKVPVTGTMAKPAVDPRLFQAAVATLTRDAAKGVGRDLLNKELEKLFPAMPGLPKK